MKLLCLLPAVALVRADNDPDQLVCEAGQPCIEAINEAAAAVNDTPSGNNNEQPCSCTENADGTKTFNHCTIRNAVNLETEGGCVGPRSTGCTKKPKKRFGLQFQIPVINNYGCWCYGGQYWPGARDWTGFGPFMDLYDDACKAHHQGFDCITMDANAEGESCIPNETTYSLLVTPQANGNYVIECDDSIEFDWCKRRTCMVDLRFLARHWKLESDGVEPDYAQYGHAGFHDNAGNFDTDVCILPRPTGPGGHVRNVVKVCCGDYPYRVWYDRSNNRGIRCCEHNDPSVDADYGFTIKIGTLFNNMAATCCPYGVINDGNVC